MSRIYDTTGPEIEKAVREVVDVLVVEGRPFLLATEAGVADPKAPRAKGPVAGKGRKTASRPAQSGVCQLKVTLRGIKPPIWRRFQVREDITLAGLHETIQAVMGWESYHLYEFEIGGKKYGEPGPEFDYRVSDAGKTRLKKVLAGEGTRFLYAYDFGDGWEHTIEVEGFLPPEEGVQYPVCLKGKRACPPEDCGGIWGYQRLLEVIQDPNDEEYAEMMEWLGGSFDSEAFDLEAINDALHDV